MARGEWTQLSGEWANPTAMTALGDRLYITEGTLYRVDSTGGYEALGDDEWRSRWVLAAAGWLVTIEESGAMYRVDPKDGSWVQLESSWGTTIAATAGGDSIFVISRSGMLYRVQPSDGSYQEIEGEFADTQLLVAAGGALVSIEPNGRMYRISAKDGTWEQYDDSWHHCRAAAGDDHTLYVVSGDQLWAMDVKTGTYEQIGTDSWGSRLLAVMGGALYSLEPDGRLYRVEL
jgi:hypothetical protein